KKRYVKRNNSNPSRQRTHVKNQLKVKAEQKEKSSPGYCVQQLSGHPSSEFPYPQQTQVEQRMLRPHLMHNEDYKRHYASDQEAVDHSRFRQPIRIISQRQHKSRNRN